MTCPRSIYSRGFGEEPRGTSARREYLRRERATRPSSQRTSRQIAGRRARARREAELRGGWPVPKQGGQRTAGVSALDLGGVASPLEWLVQCYE